MAKCALIGVGNMGSALLRGVCASGVYHPSDIVIFDPKPETRSALAAELGVTAVESAERAYEGAELVVFAVKPPQMLACLASLPAGPRVAISVAAGVGLEEMHAVVAPGVIPVRVMPNTPALVGKGMTTYCIVDADPAVCATVEAFFGGVGKVERLADEALMDPAMSIAGCGPAYVFRFVEALARAGEMVGLEASQAMRLARETIIGAAHLLEQSEEPAGLLRHRVTSPGGTTAEALRIFDGHGVSGADLDNLTAEAARAAAEHGERMRQRLLEAHRAKAATS